MRVARFAMNYYAMKKIATYAGITWAVGIFVSLKAPASDFNT